MGGDPGQPYNFLPNCKALFRVIFFVSVRGEKRKLFYFAMSLGRNVLIFTSLGHPPSFSLLCHSLPFGTPFFSFSSVLLGFRHARLFQFLVRSAKASISFLIWSCASIFDPTGLMFYKILLAKFLMLRTVINKSRGQAQLAKSLITKYLDCSVCLVAFYLNKIEVTGRIADCGWLLNKIIWAHKFYCIGHVFSRYLKIPQLLEMFSALLEAFLPSNIVGRFLLG